MTDEAGGIKTCPRCRGAWAGNIRRCPACQEDMSGVEVRFHSVQLVHEPDMDWCVVCSVTGLPLLDTKAQARRYTEAAARKAAERMDQKMDVERRPDVRYYARRLTDDERRQKNG